MRQQHSLPREAWELLLDSDLFVSELDNLIAKLGISEFDLYGHSWGGTLGGSFAVSKKPSVSKLNKLIIASAPARMSDWVDAQWDLVKQMPTESRDAITKGELTRNYEPDDYQAAVLEFNQQHLCRLWPFPSEILESLQLFSEDDTVAYSMLGLGLVEIFGTLRGK